MISSLLDRLLHRKAKVYFVYANEHRASGSTVMRGYQLADITSKGLGGGHRVRVVPYTKRLSNAVLIFTKGAIYSCPVPRLEKLNSMGNQIVFDPVDGRIDDDKLQYADAIIAASKIAYDRYPETYPGKRVFLVYHHADPRIRVKPAASRVEPRIGYFGEPANTIITESLKKRVDFIRTDTSSQADLRWLDNIADYDVHYAVRKAREFDDIKPATKVFNAARCNANVIVQDAELEALEWLGKDYPYLIKGEVTEKKILEMLAFVKDSYGSKEWERGLETMREIREQISEESVGGQAVELITELFARPAKRWGH